MFPSRTWYHPTSQKPQRREQNPYSRKFWPVPSAPSVPPLQLHCNSLEYTLKVFNKTPQILMWSLNLFSADDKSRKYQVAVSVNSLPLSLWVFTFHQPGNEFMLLPLRVRFRDRNTHATSQLFSTHQLPCSKRIQSSLLPNPDIKSTLQSSLRPGKPSEPLLWLPGLG